MDSSEETRFMNELFRARQEQLETDPRRELRGDGRSFGATPLANGAEQYSIFLDLEKRIKDSAPKGVSKEIRKFFRGHFASRFYLRQVRNFQSFNDRAVDDIDSFDDETAQRLDLALDGEAAPYELLNLMGTLKMPSIELARLTHPYGKGIEPNADGTPNELDRMRDAANYAVELEGGRAFEPDEIFSDGTSNTSYELDEAHVRSFDRSHLGPGFLMKRKRIVGVLPNGTEVVERSSFVINVKAVAKFDAEIAERLGAVVVRDNPHWMEDIMAIDGFEEMVVTLLEKNKFKAAIPLSTTIYAHNEARELEVQAEKDADKQSRDAWAEQRRLEHEEATARPSTGVFYGDHDDKDNARIIPEKKVTVLGRIAGLLTDKTRRK